MKKLQTRRAADARQGDATSTRNVDAATLETRRSARAKARLRRVERDRAAAARRALGRPPRGARYATLGHESDPLVVHRITPREVVLVSLARPNSFIVASATQPLDPDWWIER